MALLQISEPGFASDPHQRRHAIGIDLGTTHSLVATVRSGEAQVLADAQGRTLLPSVVRYLPDGHPTQVGYTALEEIAEDPLNTIASAKRLMGKALGDIVPGSMPYRLSGDHPDGGPVPEGGSGVATVPRAGLRQVAIETVAGPRTAIEVSAEILRCLRCRAEASLGLDDGEIDGAVITVPAYFDDAQRQATRDAARLAGIPVLRLLNEPTAAAVAYGLDERQSGVFVVYDLGGGTFDVSVLRLSRGVFEVIATAGDAQLGGDDFDAAVAAGFSERHDLGPAAELARRAPGLWRRVMVAARQCRETLSSEPSAEMRVTRQRPARTAQGASAGGAEELRWTLDRTELAVRVEHLVQRTLDICRRALEDAGLDHSELDGVVLVGGATRMPVVREAVERHFGSAPYTGLDPDRVVALGAAKQADQLVGNRSATEDGWLLLDVTPLSLGLETMGGLVERIVERNSSIPVARAQEFTTFRDGQTAMALHVVQGERELVADCRSLARFELRGIPAMVAGAARIRVTFQVDADGLLAVEARELGTGVQASVEVRPSYGLEDGEIERMLRDSFGAAALDRDMRAMREQRLEAEQLLGSTASALERDADLLDMPARQRILDLCDALRAQVLDPRSMGADLAWRDTLQDATRALLAETEAFAALRMDRAISEALSGRTVDEVASGRPVPMA